MQARLLVLELMLLYSFQSGLKVSVEGEGERVGGSILSNPSLRTPLISSSSGLLPTSSDHSHFRLPVPLPASTPSPMTFPLLFFYLFVSYCATSPFLASIIGLASVLSGFSIKLDCWGRPGWGYALRISE
jgi:hypothetical protein